MSKRVDELFGGDPDLPPVKPKGRTINALMWTGGPMVVAGAVGAWSYPIFLVTWLSVPGAALVLVAWIMADSELARVESGYLATDLGDGLEKTRRLAFWLLVISALSFMVQITFLANGTYEAWLLKLASSG